MSFTTPPSFPGSYEILSSDLNSYWTNDLVWLNNAHGCQLHRSASASIPNNAFTTVNWDVEDDDTDAYHSLVSTTSRITIPTGLAGVYQITGNLAWFSNTSGYREARLLKNGTAAKASIINPSGGSAGTYQNFAFTLRLAAADYIEIQAAQNSGAGLSIDGGDATKSWFCAYLVGA